MTSKKLFNEILSHTVILISEQDPKKAKGTLKLLRALLFLIEAESKYATYQQCWRQYCLANYHYSLLTQSGKEAKQSPLNQDELISFNTEKDATDHNVKMHSAEGAINNLNEPDVYQQMALEHLAQRLDELRQQRQNNLAQQQQLKSKHNITLTDYQILKQHANLPEYKAPEMHQLCELTRELISLKSNCSALESGLEEVVYADPP